MKKTRFTGSQIVAILGEAEAGMKVKDLCRKHGISDVTYYNWRAKYGGMSVSELKRTRNWKLRMPSSSACTHPEPAHLSRDHAAAAGNAPSGPSRQPGQ